MVVPFLGLSLFKNLPNSLMKRMTASGTRSDSLLLRLNAVNTLGRTIGLPHQPSQKQRFWGLLRAQTRQPGEDRQTSAACTTSRHLPVGFKSTRPRLFTDALSSGSARQKHEAFMHSILYPDKKLEVSHSHLN